MWNLPVGDGGKRVMTFIRKGEQAYLYACVCSRAVSTIISASFLADCGRANDRAAALIFVRRGASSMIRVTSATRRCGVRLCCSKTPAAPDLAYEKAFSVWSWDISVGIGTRMDGSPHEAISKIVPLPARDTTTAEIPAAMRRERVQKAEAPVAVRIARIFQND